MGRATLDLWLMAGVPLLSFGAALALPGSLSPGLALGLTLAFSFPHFSASYAVFYGSRSVRAAHPVVGKGLPIALAAALAAAVTVGPRELLGVLVQGTLMLLYWHYLKQVYGVALWLGGPGASSKLKRGLLLVCLLLGVTGFLGVYRNGGAEQIFGVYVTLATVPAELLDLFRWGALTGTVVLGAAWTWTYVRNRPATPHPRGFLAVLALWTWVDPVFDGSPARMILPVFHGLQYLGFPLRVIHHELPVESPGRRTAWMVFGVVPALAAAGFVGLRWLPDQTGAAAVAVVLFFNLHHYALDSVLWRFRDPEVLRRLRGSARHPPASGAAAAASPRQSAG